MARGGILRLIPTTSGAQGGAGLSDGWSWHGDLMGRWSAARLVLPALLVVAVGVGLVTPFRPLLALAAALALGLVACVWARPAVAAYLIIALTPLTAGIGRGLAIPFLRPNEALAVFVGAVVIARSFTDLRTGRLPTFRRSRVALSIILMAIASSIVPLLWMAVLQRQITHDDLLYSFVLWKYLGLYLIVRLAVRTEHQVRTCLWLSMAAASLVAVIAILQSRGLFGVSHLLTTYYAPYGNTNALANARGSSTLALPAATGDLLIFNLAIACGMWLREGRHKVVLACAAALFLLGTVAAGETSTMIGLGVAVLCIVAVTGTPRLLLAFVPAGAAAAVALWPVISRRLSGFGSVYGLPVSWVGRLQNLRTYFWPTLFSHWNFVLGVRPSARVVVASQVTGYVWIESGYTWLLWGGGLPLLASYLYFVYATLKMSWTAAHRDHGAASVAGVAAFVAVVVTATLMAFDPHLTYRGSADALFFLLALAGPRRRHDEGRERVLRLAAAPALRSTVKGEVL
jgi:hypothetical protein